MCGLLMSNEELLRKNARILRNETGVGLFTCYKVAKNSNNNLSKARIKLKEMILKGGVLYEVNT
jgi:translation elongation factor EF-Ts